MNPESFQPSEPDRPERMDEFDQLLPPAPDRAKSETAAVELAGQPERPHWSPDSGLAIPYNELAEAAETAIDRVHPAGERAASSATAIPWRENPENPEPRRYLDDAAARSQLRQVLRTEGFNDRALALINPSGGRYALQRTQNCGECARAVASVLNGHGRPACPLLPRYLDDGSIEFGEDSQTMEAALGRPEEFDRNFAGRRLARLYEVDHDRADPEVVRQFDVLEAELLRDGPGSHATVALIWKPFEDHPSGRSSGHWLNAANVDGKIVYIDGQRAERGERNAPFMRRYQQDAMGISWIRADRKHD